MQCHKLSLCTIFYKITYHVIIIVSSLEHKLWQVWSIAIVAATIIDVGMSVGEKTSFCKIRKILSLILMRKNIQNLDKNGKRNSNNLMIKNPQN